MQEPNIQVNTEHQRQLLKNCILLGYRGSIAHGMYLPGSDPNSVDDRDVMGVFVAPLACYTGLSKDEGQEWQAGEWDVVVYELRKYIRLLLKCNPNVMSLLWLRPEDHIVRTPFGEELIRNRDQFSSRLAYKSFCGYAESQFRKMDRGNKYLGYMGARRKALVDKYGYDIKNAAHLIRLLRMGLEFLKTGELTVYRPDSEELLTIKHGKWSKQKVLEEAGRLFAEMEEAVKVSPLPEKPSFEMAEMTCMGIIRDYYRLFDRSAAHRLSNGVMVG